MDHSWHAKLYIRTMSATWPVTKWQTIASGVLIIFAGLIVLSAAAQTQREIEIKVSPDGSYWIGFRVNWLQTEYWLKSGPLMVRNNDKVYTTEDGSLILKPDSFNEFANILMGPVRRYSWTWVTSDNSLELDTTHRNVLPASCPSVSELVLLQRRQRKDVVPVIY